LQHVKDKIAGRFCKTRWERSSGKTYITTKPEFAWGFRKIMKHLKLKNLFPGHDFDIMNQ
jgi:hypothetical protein